MLEVNSTNVYVISLENFMEIYVMHDTDTLQLPLMPQ